MAILVYGATGFIGSLVARALCDAGHRVILSGRDRRRLTDLAENLAASLAEKPAASRAEDPAESPAEHPAGGIEVRPAAVTDADALAAALAGATAMIACAAPFDRVGEPLVRAAIARRVPYLDTATGQGFLRDVYERHEAEARRAGVTVVSGIGWQVALADFAAHIVADEVSRRSRERAGERGPSGPFGPLGATEPGIVVDSVATAYALTRFRSSAGTRAAALASLAGPSYVWSGDRWDRVSPGAEYRPIHFGSALGDCDTVLFPAGEIITIPRHVTARTVKAYVSLSAAGPLGSALARSAPLVGPAVGWLLRSPLAAQARALVHAGPREPSAVERGFSELVIAATARHGIHSEQVLLSARDPYGVAAALAAWAAGELASGVAGKPGVRAPAEVFDARRALAALVARGALELHTSFSAR